MRAGGPDAVWAAELDAALNGDGQGRAAEEWRELRADVRSLAPPLDPVLEQRLREEIDRRTARTRRRSSARSLRLPHSLPARAVALAVVVLAIAGLGAAIHSYLGSSRRLGSAVVADSGRVRQAEGGDRLGASGSAAVRPDNEAQQPLPSVAHRKTYKEFAKTIPSTAEHDAKSSSTAAGAPASSSAEASTPSEEAAAAPGHVQQLSASLSLATTPANVQAISDGVSRLAVGAGGFVASSHVQVQQASGEASLMLRLPTARLSTTLASIAHLAAVRSESQSLQDITSSYDSARRQLADANAEQAALLRTLAKAQSAGEIDSLREQLSQSRSSIAHDQAALHAVSQRASNAEVEVTVLGSAHGEGGGLSVHRGLHDAGRVLSVVLAVLLIGAAVLVPLALLIAALALAARAWRRSRREHALDVS